MALRGSSGPETPRSVPEAQLALVGLWLGASGFFSLAVAPAAFAALPSRELAGALVGRLLPILFWSGAVVGVVLIALELLGGEQRYRVGRVVSAAVVVSACMVAQLAIAPRIAALRAAMSVSLADLAADDSQRIAFGRLHLWSVAWLGAAMLAAMVAAALVLIILRRRGRS
jgi:hypothetical protein